jgi:hypothetical protein
MKSLFKIIQVLIFVFILTGCYTNVIEDSNIVQPTEEIKNTTVKGTVNIDGTDLSVQTVMGKSRLDGGYFEVPSIVCDIPQLLFIDDNNDNTILMARGFYSSNDYINIDVQSTVLALVTSHPLLSPITGDDFYKLITLITNAEHYQDLYNEVAMSIENRQDIFDTNNMSLLLALSNLMEDICGGNNIMTRSVISNWELLNINNPYPFLVEIKDNIMSITNTALSPKYDGTIYHSIIGTQKMVIPTRDGYGGLELIKQATYGWSSGAWGDLGNGEPVEFKFTDEGEYKFLFMRNDLDFYLNFVKDLFDEFGFSFQDIMLHPFINDIAGKALMDGLLTLQPGADPVDMFKELADVVVDYFTDDVFKITSEGKAFYEKYPNAESHLGKAAKILKYYSLIKGASNALLRIGWKIKAPEKVDFCLCYYNGEVSSCTETSLVKVEHTDEQRGFANQKLLLPIQVLVSSMASDGNYVESSYQKVKFEVLSGGGSVSERITDTNETNFAETSWTLGDEGEQKVRAIVIDMITGQEVSNEVIFTAILEEDADLTVRLDWHKLSGNTDIDLHVTDPYGEEIAYYNMSSASGGWLDRDDVVGPGPEHIHWAKAPSGVYLVQVHYYGSESGAVTSFEVNINANGKNFGPYRGSIGYDQLITIGAITMPEATITQIRSSNSAPIFIEKMKMEENKKSYPRKNKK